MLELEMKAYNKETKTMVNVLSIDFVNYTVWVLPNEYLEGGNQIEWYFSDIELYIFIIEDEKDERIIHIKDLFEPSKNEEILRKKDKYIFFEK